MSYTTMKFRTQITEISRSLIFYRYNRCVENMKLRFEKFDRFAGLTEKSRPAAGHQQNPVEHIVDFRRRLVDSADHRFALGRHVLKHADNVLRHKRVESGRRFVAKHQRRVRQ